MFSWRQAGVYLQCPQAATCSLAPGPDLPTAGGVAVALIAGNSSRAYPSQPCPTQSTWAFAREKWSSHLFHQINYKKRARVSGIVKRTTTTKTVSKFGLVFLPCPTQWITTYFNGKSTAHPLSPKKQGEGTICPSMEQAGWKSSKKKERLAAWLASQLSESSFESWNARQMLRAAIQELLPWMRTSGLAVNWQNSFSLNSFGPSTVGADFPILSCVLLQRCTKLFQNSAKLSKNGKAQKDTEWQTERS